MNIAVVGLGLIGGSICKAIKKYTGHFCMGLDRDEATLRAALSHHDIDAGITRDELDKADITIVCLYPADAISFIRDCADLFRKGSTVADVCGVKEAVTEGVSGILADKGVDFVGTHPMAGREFSGYKYAQADLFRGASFIITPSSATPAGKTEMMAGLATSIGFGKIVHTTPAEHDRIIAYTSQLAHLLSNAYVKSPTLKIRAGFSAGSFDDLTRVARLNEDMWASLFTINQNALLFELNTIIDSLNRYRDALERGDAETLRVLLREGRILKETNYTGS